MPGKLLYTADTLSRAPVKEVYSLPLQDEVELFMESEEKTSQVDLPYHTEKPAELGDVLRGLHLTDG